MCRDNRRGRPHEGHYGSSHRLRVASLSSFEWGSEPHRGNRRPDQALGPGAAQFKRAVQVDRSRALRYGYSVTAGWSSPVARWAHNPKVAGSNPAPATNRIVQLHGGRHRPPPSTIRLLSDFWRIRGVQVSRAYALPANGP